MADSVFQRADLRYFASALADMQTHSGISQFELALGISTTGNKTERATAVLRHIFGLEDADDWTLQLLNYLFVDNPYADTESDSGTYRILKGNVLDKRGVRLGDDGFSIVGQSRAEEPRTSLARSEALPTPREPMAAGSVEASSLAYPLELPHLDRDRKKVFVVHGRDKRPVEVVEQFLQYLGLQMMAWHEAVHLTSEVQPHTYDIVTAGMRACGAVIVIFSPDDVARVKDDYSEEHDADRALQGQARQNVVLEAGMAFATARERTIFLKSAETREISDIAGFNWVRLDGLWASRQDLRQRLLSANLDVRTGEYDLMATAAGPFCVTDG